MPVLTKITTPAKVPVITGEEGPLHGGGLATVGVDYYELGKIAGNMGADILEGKAKPADMPIQYQKEFKVKVNEPVLKTLGLQLPESARSLISAPCLFLFVKKKKSRLGVLRQKRRFQTKLVTWLIF